MTARDINLLTSYTNLLTCTSYDGSWRSDISISTASRSGSEGGNERMHICRSTSGSMSHISCTLISGGKAVWSTRKCASIFAQLIKPPPTPPPPPQNKHVEDCPICLEELPVSLQTLARNSCCGKAMHLTCRDDYRDSNFPTKEQKRRCILCRTQHPTSEQEANRRLRKWVKKGKAWAQTSLACRYRSGNGVPQSYLMAVKLYEMAIAQEEPNAMSGLGVLYNEGNGVAPSKEKAFQLYARAADLGHTGAMYNVGVMYNNGQVIEQSNDMARVWWTKAVQVEHEEGGIAKENALRGLQMLDEIDKQNTTPFCSNCGTLETPHHKLKACQRCYTKQYCNRQCQSMHWREGKHSKECKINIKIQQQAEKNKKN